MAVARRLYDGIVGISSANKIIYLAEWPEAEVKS